MCSELCAVTQSLLPPAAPSSSLSRLANEVKKLEKCLQMQVANVADNHTQAKNEKLLEAF